MNDTKPSLRLALPKGRMQDGVLRLLADAGISIQIDPRGYRPIAGLPGVDCKLLKPQSIIEMLDVGTRDAGFAGADWALELEADLVEVLDLGLDPVRLVAATSPAILEGGRLPRRELVVASEYTRLAGRWMERAGVRGRVVRSYGATEALPPDDCDVIVDTVATGSTLRANGLAVVDEVVSSSTRLYAHKRSMDASATRRRVEEIVLLLRAVLDARERVMIELNVPSAALDGVVAALPCMRRPTLASLHGEDAYAVKAAVPKRALATLVPELKARGGSDIVVYELSQIVL
jgi:ATP phosphoribosyltransferase